MKNSRISAVLLAASVAATPISGFSPVLAEEWQDETSYSFYDETAATSTDLTANGRWKQVDILPEEDFKLTSNVNISSDSAKKIVLEAVSKGVKDSRSNEDKKYITDEVLNATTLTNVDNLTGSLVYEVTTPDELQSINKNQVTVKYSEFVTPTIESVELAQNSNNVIRITLGVDWGKLFSSKPNGLGTYGRLKDMDFPNLNFDIEIKNIRFAEKPNVGRTLNITDKVKELKLLTNNVLGMNFSYTKDPKQNESKGEFVTGSTTVNIDNTQNNLGGSSATLNVVRKKGKPSGNTTSKPTPGTSVSSPDPNKAETVLRLYNPNSGEHLFTTSDAERTFLVTLGWKNEACDWKAPEISDFPIYRVYNPNNGDHHYTTSFAEKNHLVKLGWNYEGADIYSAAEGPRSIAVYRMYNPNATGAGSHHYTSSEAECDFLEEQGWNFEGIAWYGLRR